jgi:hypothetical protein
MASNMVNGTSESDIYYEPGLAVPNIYADWWLYVDAVSPYSANMKLWRRYLTSGIGVANGIAYVMFCNGTFNSQFGGGDAGGTTLFLGEDASQYAGGWHHLQLWEAENSGGLANGDAWFVRDGNNILVNQMGSFNWVGSGNHFQTFIFGEYFTHSAQGGCAAYGDAHIYLSDTYLDTTLSRIEIGNNATYANCTHREIQLPTAWSNTSVTFTVKKGSFNTGTTVNVFVIDSNNGVHIPTPATIVL